jgi:hypothetical protein
MGLLTLLVQHNRFGQRKQKSLTWKNSSYVISFILLVQNIVTFAWKPTMENKLIDGTAFQIVMTFYVNCIYAAFDFDPIYGRRWKVCLQFA